MRVSVHVHLCAHTRTHPRKSPLLSTSFPGKSSPSSRVPFCGVRIEAEHRGVGNPCALTRLWISRAKGLTTHQKRRFQQLVVWSEQPVNVDKATRRHADDMSTEETAQLLPAFVPTVTSNRRATPLLRPPGRRAVQLGWRCSCFPASPSPQLKRFDYREHPD